MDFVARLPEKKAKSLHSWIYSEALIFVPYLPAMIPKYCNWFVEDYLCRMTSTERLSPSDAEEAHRTWTCENNKIMFIVLNRKKYTESLDQVSAMMGDVNLVLRQEAAASRDGAVVVAEVMLMIGDPAFRSKGLGRQMLLLVMRYGLEEYGVGTFEARINVDNIHSLALFASCGFTKVSTDETFGEHLYEFAVDQAAAQALIAGTDNLKYRVEEQVDGSRF